MHSSIFNEPFYPEGEKFWYSLYEALYEQVAISTRSKIDLNVIDPTLKSMSSLRITSVHGARCHVESVLKRYSF